jgi:UDP-4-amino-4,6-dideoxy-N-acetyl-beta-L-altrosamine transaminase
MRNYSRQSINDGDVQTVTDTLRSDYLTSGPKVKEFEDKVSGYVNVNYAVAVNSATSALDIIVQSLDLPEGSEIITSPLTFVATGNCILYNKHKVVFADINKDNYNIDPEDVLRKITSKTRAVICVDFAGHPCDLNRLKSICKSNELYLIEDASHALGAEYNNQMVGSIADVTVFSFHAVKPITTGEGGMICTNIKAIADKCRLLRSHGIDKQPSERMNWKYDQVCLGRNYRLTDIQCALGISQLKRIENFNFQRENLFDLYNSKLCKVKGIKIPQCIGNVSHAFHLYTILLDNEEVRDRVYNYLKSKGVGVNVHYIPIYKFTYYRSLGYNISLPNTEYVYSRILSLPLHVGLLSKDINYIVKCLKEVVK